MSDNVVTPPSGVTVATDEINGNHYQLIKPAFGPLDSATLVGLTTPFPVQEQPWNTIAGPSGATVDTTVKQILTSAQTLRKRVFIQNQGPDPVYIGHANTVTGSSGAVASRGIKLVSGGSLERYWGPSVPVWVICDGSCEIVYEESAL